MKTVVRDIQKLFGATAVVGLSDGQLLDRFITRREGASLEALVLRHGPMVWGVCHRVLRDHHDAEDAFQATFLVLSRKADSIMPREKVGNWLYGVAYQTALKARSTRAKMRTRESHMPDVPEPEAATSVPKNDLADLLDAELSRLPDKYRTPIVLCELEGKSHGEAAEQLGWPVGTLSGRLSRGRTMLAERLSRRGVVPFGGALAVLMALNQCAASAQVPALLLSATAHAAILYATGHALAEGVSAPVAALTRKVLNAMLFTKVKITSLALLALTVVGLGFWQANTWAQGGVRPDGNTPAAENAVSGQELSEGTFRVVVTDIIRDDSTLVLQIDIAAPAKAKIEILTSKPNHGGQTFSSEADQPDGLLHVRLVLLVDHVQPKEGGPSLVKFMLDQKFGKISNSTSDTVPMPAKATGLVDLLTMPLKAGVYKYKLGQPAPLVTFNGLTYKLVVNELK